MRDSGTTQSPEHSLTIQEKETVERELAEILRSGPFRTTRQCQDLLRYVVRHTVSHEDESLRERIIGAEVFGRKRDYDTGEDPVVRIRAADVRKRLAQYYQQAEPGQGGVRIDIPSGSYRAVFEWLKPAVQESTPLVLASQVEEAATPPTAFLSEVPAGGGRFRGKMWWPVAGALLLLLAIGVSLRLSLTRLRPAAPTAIELFWSPVLSSPKPALIYIGSNAAYRFSETFLENYRASHHLENNGPEFFVELGSADKIRTSDLVPVRNSFITVGDVAASAELTSLLTHYNKPYQLRFASDVSFGDLRNTPTVLIGGFNNNWTIAVTDDLRFVLKDGDRIVDQQQKDQSWSVIRKPDGSASTDYAVISRLLSSKTGGAVIAAAGVGQSGTQAAGEFLANPQKLAELLNAAPPGWSRKNMQIVLHVKVVDAMPSSTEVVATHVW